MNLLITAFIIWGRSKGGLAGGGGEGLGETQRNLHAEAVISKTYSYYKKTSKNYFQMTKFPSFSANTFISWKPHLFSKGAGPQTPKILSLLQLVYLNPFIIILDPSRHFNEIQEFIFFWQKKILGERKT